MNLINAAAKARPRRRLLPGFGMTMGFSILYLSLVVLLPLSALLFNSTGLSWAKFWDVATDARVLASYRVSLSTAAGAALIDAVLGLLLAWVLLGVPLGPGGPLEYVPAAGQ